MFFTPVVPFVPDTKLIGLLGQLGLTSSLQLCVDAGDAGSYPSGQTWSDVSSNSNSYFRGLNGSSQSTDPTFNGVAGQQSSAEYFSFDGGDGFWPTGSHTFANGWHKDNATFTVATWLWSPGAGLSIIRNIFGTSNRGMFVAQVSVAGGGKVRLVKLNGSGSSQNLEPPTNDVTHPSEWDFLALSFSEGSGNSFAQARGFQENLSSDTYTSPSASDPTLPTLLFGSPDSAGTNFEPSIYPESGTRVNSVLAWNRALSKPELLSLYETTKGKFGL